MNKINLAKHLEHTILKPNAILSVEVLKKEIRFVSENNISNLVIPPYYIKQAQKLNTDDITLCSVIGFPLGYHTLNTKIFEMQEAIKYGAKEIDIVLNNTLVANNKFEKILEEFKSFRKNSNNDTILKMIIETSLLTKEQILKITELLIIAQFDFVKTSTGFIGLGAQLKDIQTIKENFNNDIKIKASGGIKDLKTVEQFIKAGASKIGTSSAKEILINANRKDENTI